MNGIAGIWINSGQEPSDLTWVMAGMLDLMRHRGPGDPAWRTYKGGILGQVGGVDTLSFAGEGLARPGETRQFAVAFDGHLYNHMELRRALEATGAVFHGDDQEETILQAYRCWGLDCFRHFNGMWSLALWDPDTGTLILSRDRVGIKPLYWGTSGDRLAFASELKSMAAFRRLTGQHLEINSESVRQFLNNALTDGLEESFFHGILHFKPGHFMEIADGRIRSYRSYWDLPKRAMSLREKTREQSEEEKAKHLFGLLQDTVKTYATADESMGVYLTGDLNSSAVAGISRRIQPRLKAFTPWFERAGYPGELENARQMSIAFGLDWRRVDLDGDAVMGRLPELLWRLETPFMDMSVYPLYETMEKAAKEVTVFCDGLGGDELFAGLESHPARLLASLLTTGRTGEYQRFLQAYAQIDGKDRAEKLDQEAGRLLIGKDRGSQKGPFDGILTDFLHRELIETRIPALLRCRDRLAASFSMEYRAPLLDHRLIETAFALEEEWKVVPGKSKYILRRALDQFLPFDITWGRENKGLLLPFQFWADDTQNLAMRQLLLGENGYLKTTIGEDLLFGFFRAWDHGHKNHWQLWHLVCLETWLQTWLDRLTQEINVFLESRQQSIEPIPSGYQAVLPVEVILAVRYGGVAGPEQESAIQSFDYQRDLIQPTNELVHLLQRHSAPLTLLWDAADYFHLIQQGRVDQAEAMKKQLQSLAGEGHDVQLYLDADWLDLPEERLKALLDEAVRTLNAWIKPFRPDYAVRGFRSGAVSADARDTAIRHLMALGLKADGSLKGVGPFGVKAPGMDQPVDLKAADFLEYPALTRENDTWDLQASPLMPVSKLKGDPPVKPPFGAALVMTRRIQGPINLFEVELCLNHLEQEYGGRLHFCRWQESIDRRLSVMQGEWRGE